MNPIRFTITAGSLPLGYCFTTPQDLVNKFAQVISVQWNVNFAVWNVGPNKPASGNNDRPWLRTDGAGNIDRIYTFVSGAWESPHPLFPGFNTIYTQPDGSITADLSLPGFYDTLDGGSAGVVTRSSGPFWSLISVMQGRFPVGVDVGPGHTYYPAGLPGPKANDPPGFQPNGPANSMIPYNVVPIIHRTAREVYQIL